MLASVAGRPWNLYPDFESAALRTAIANAYGFTPENILVGNGSNELLAATIGAFVGPGTPVVFPRPTFALYEKLVTIAGGLPIPIEFEPDSGLLPLDEMLAAIGKYDSAVAIVCSPNNPTGGVLPPGGLEALLGSGAMVLLDQAYADFAHSVAAGFIFEGPEIDGGHFLPYVLPRRAGPLLRELERYGPLLLVVILLSGAAGFVLDPVIRWVSGIYVAVVKILV